MRNLTLSTPPPLALVRLACLACSVALWAAAPAMAQSQAPAPGSSAPAPAPASAPGQRPPPGSKAGINDAVARCEAMVDEAQRARCRAGLAKQTPSH